MYKQIERDFYTKQLFSRNPLRRWFHHSRYQIANNLVKERFLPPMKIVDLGCGSCNWNIDKIPLTGIDLNDDLMSVGKSRGRIADALVISADATCLPDESFDIVTAFEFLEHSTDYQAVIAEIFRILKPGGHIIVSVPYDTILSLWRPLFFLQVIYQGYLRGKAYYRRRCGHINHFNPQTLQQTFRNNGFEIIEVYSHYRFNIFLTARKPRAIEDKPK